MRLLVYTLPGSYGRGAADISSAIGIYAREDSPRCALLLRHLNG